MSEMTGADLAQLDSLALQFTTAGQEIATKGEVLRTKIQTAIAAFNGSLTTMQSTTTNLTAATDAEMTGLKAQGDSIVWTGNNRNGFDSNLSAFDAEVRRGSSQMNADIALLKGQVDSSFTPVMEDFGVQLAAASDDVNVAATNMNVTVTNQRTNLDQAANVGWTDA